MAMPAAVTQTAATQWLERTLDDSAVRRLTLPQAFLGIDAILQIYLNVVPGMVVNEPVIARHVVDELPFMATENLMMAAVQSGGDRQEVHERIRRHSLEARLKLVEHGGDNDLVLRLQADQAFSSLNFDDLLDPSKYVGRSPEQVDAFLASEVEPIRRRHPHLRARRRELGV